MGMFNNGGGGGGGGNTMVIVLLLVCCCCCLMSSTGAVLAYLYNFMGFKDWFDGLLGTKVDCAANPNQQACCTAGTWDATTSTCTTGSAPTPATDYTQYTSKPDCTNGGGKWDNGAKTCGPPDSGSPPGGSPPGNSPPGGSGCDGLSGSQKYWCKFGCSKRSNGKYTASGCSWPGQKKTCDDTADPDTCRRAVYFAIRNSSECKDAFKKRATVAKNGKNQYVCNKPGEGGTWYDTCMSIDNKRVPPSVYAGAQDWQCASTEHCASMVRYMTNNKSSKSCGKTTVV